MRPPGMCPGGRAIWSTSIVPLITCTEDIAFARLHTAKSLLAGVPRAREPLAPGLAEAYCDRCSRC